MQLKRLLVLTAAIIAVVGSAPEDARAQAYPSKFIRLVLPFTPSSPNDILARLVAPRLSARLGQTVVIENRPGGGTSIGLKAVMAAEPDGYTLLWTNSPTHFITPVVSKNFTYDPLSDFVPIALVGTSSNVLVIPPSVPAKTVPEFVAYLKANPGKLNFGYGQGTLPQLIGEMFKAATGADVGMIPYKGGAQSVTDMLGGQIHMNLGTLSTLLPLIRDGRLRALAVTSPARSHDLPEVPTFIESGYPSVTTVSYYGVFGPKGIPAELVNKLNREVNETLTSPELVAGMARANFEPHGGTPQEFSVLLADEMQKWIPIVKSTGFQME
jgi:tripartite-type tricarboxylate transporter receptor subunit TctC